MKKKKSSPFRKIASFIARGRFFTNFNYFSIPSRAYSDEGERTVMKPVTKSELGIRFPFNLRSSFSIICSNLQGTQATSILKDKNMLNFISRRATVDAVFTGRLGIFTGAVGIANILDARDIDPLLDLNGKAFTRGKNLFVSFTCRF